MDNELVFRFAVLLTMLAFLAIRGFYRVRTRTLRHQVESSQDIRAMRLFLPVVGLLGLGLLIWLINPAWLRATAVSLPAGLGLMSANGLALALPLAFAVFFWLRVPREEAMMVGAFGAEYQAYRQRTGRFVPRWAGESVNAP